MDELMRRRRALMAAKKKTPAEYVTDGLGLHLDAIDNDGTAHDASFYNWVDKIKGTVFTQYPTVTEKPFNTNYFNFDGTQYFVLHNNDKAWSTIEIVADFYGTKTELVFKTAPTNTSPIGVVSKKSGAICFKGGGSLSAAMQQGRHTYCCDGTSVYIDGVKAQSAGVSSTWSAAGVWTIGYYMPGASYEMTGNLYAIRCYEKVLSEAEIANNAAVDAARFS